MLQWSVDPSDYLKSPPSRIEDRVLSRVKPGAIVVLHDGGGDRSHTVAMLADLIAKLQVQGYEFALP